MDYIDTSGPTSTVLTREDLLRAFKACEEASYPPPHGSEENPHILHPDSLTKDGLYTCMGCGPVPVRDGKIDWDWGVEQMRSAR